LQAGNLDRLGAELRKQGQVLSYHFHEPEFRCAAREFHHMMLGTDPRNVTLCLDAHWVFRGASDSQVALFDIVKLYGPRISELHLRQSSGGVWTETFGSGDIDYPRLAAELVKMKIRPHVVLEQAAEAKTPKTMGAVEAHQKGVAYTRKVFAALGS
jgi:inosose dehydratase